MPAPDARTRNKISLRPAKVLSTSYVSLIFGITVRLKPKLNRIPGKHIPRILLSNALFVFSLYASKEWLLDLDVGVFWVVMRVLACGGLCVLFWEVMSGQVVKRNSIEVRCWFYGHDYTLANNSFFCSGIT
jgi:zinc transporter 5/7